MSVLQIYLLFSLLLAISGCEQLRFQKLTIIRAWLFWPLVSYLALTLLIEVVSSFSWPKSSDVAFLYYMSWLVNEHDYKPYLQLFDTSFPGTFLIHSLLCRIFGYGDIGFHVLDTVLLAMLLIMTWLLLKTINKRVAFVAVVFYGLYYLKTYSSMHMQRDYLGILPIVASLLVVQLCEKNRRVSHFLIGAFFAISASIKPHFLLGLPVVMTGNIFMHEKNAAILHWRTWASAISFTAIGLLAWLVIIIAWLFAKGGLGGFIDMTLNYLPLYLSLDGGHQESYGPVRWLPFLREILDSAKLEWIVACVALIWGCINVGWERKKIVFMLMLILLLTAYIFYVFLGGKGWDYHWMPFRYFAIIGSSFLLIPCAKKNHTILWMVPATAFCFLFIAGFVKSYKLFLTPVEAYQKLENVRMEYKSYPYRDKNTEMLSAYLKMHTQPGDKVEVRATGTTGPFFNAMLELQLLPVSSYPLQLMFYRTIDKTYIVDAKKILLQQLVPPPRFILDDNQFSLLAKPDGSSGFPEYEDFLKNNYTLVYDNKASMEFPNQFLVYERQSPRQLPNPAASK